MHALGYGVIKFCEYDFVHMAVRAIFGINTLHNQVQIQRTFIKRKNIGTNLRIKERESGRNVLFPGSSTASFKCKGFIALTGKDK